MYRRVGLLLMVVAPLGAGTSFAQSPAARLAHAMHDADQVVVGEVEAVQPSWQTNSHGDQLIVSRAWIHADETLKSDAREGNLSFEIEGGTIDGLTLRVSDLPELKHGDKAVFLLKRNAKGTLVPHLREQAFYRRDAS